MHILITEVLCWQTFVLIKYTKLENFTAHASPPQFFFGPGVCRRRRRRHNNAGAGLYPNFQHVFPAIGWKARCQKFLPSACWDRQDCLYKGRLRQDEGAVPAQIRKEKEVQQSGNATKNKTWCILERHVGTIWKLDSRVIGAHITCVSLYTHIRTSIVIELEAARTHPQIIEKMFSSVIETVFPPIFWLLPNIFDKSTPVRTSHHQL